MRLAILECYPERAIYVKELIEKADTNCSVSIFKLYEGEEPTEHDAYILTGGIIRVQDKDKHPHLARAQELIKQIAQKEKPLLGICLGQQLIADAFGGEVKESEELEVGFHQVSFSPNSLWDSTLQPYFFMYHWDYISKLPGEFKSLGYSDLCKYQCIQHVTKPIFGVQFHPEYSGETARLIIEYLKEEIQEEELDYEAIMQTCKLYSEENNIKVIQNFLKLA